MADETLLKRIRTIADNRGISFAEAVRRALTVWADRQESPLRFIGIVATGDGPHDTGRRSADMQFEPDEWRS